MEKKKRLSFPHAYVLLFGIIVFVGILTYLVPAGTYDRVVENGKEVVVPGSFHYVNQSPVSPFNFFTAVPRGFMDAAPLLIMIIIIGASIRVFDSTGSIRNAVMSLVNKFGPKGEKLVLILIIVFFSILGGFPGMLEAAIPFAPLCIGLALALGYDALVGISISLVAIVMGWSAGPSNPWTTGLGQSIAGIKMFSGFEVRLVIWFIFTTSLIGFVLLYASKIKKNPQKSVVYGMDTEHLQTEISTSKFTSINAVILSIFALTIFFVVFGSLKWKFGIPEMCATYIIGAIAAGLVARYSTSKIADEMIDGAKVILIGAGAAGLARGIGIIMADGQIADTVVHFLSTKLQGYPPGISSVLMFFLQGLINLFIPSGTGQAYATLPILLPVGDLVGVSKQMTILTYQFGDGLTNIFYPTVGGLIAFLMYAKIPFNKWLKFIFPFLLFIVGISIVIILVLSIIGFS